MQNRQVSGSSAYWFRCIPHRLGFIATFLISKPDPRHSLLLRATVGATEPWVGGRAGETEPEEVRAGHGGTAPKQ